MLTKDSFKYISIEIEPKEGKQTCLKDSYGIFHKDKLMVFKKGNAKQINKDKRIPEMMIKNYKNITGLELEVKFIPIMFY
jgi:hypothetical protein